MRVCPLTGIVAPVKSRRDVAWFWASYPIAGALAVVLFLLLNVFGVFP